MSIDELYDTCDEFKMGVVGHYAFSINDYSIFCRCLTVHTCRCVQNIEESFRIDASKISEDSIGQGWEKKPENSD